MPFSHHSHSGQFCGHATNTLEEVVQTAISKGMRMFAMTEHMPRDTEDLYPEEITENVTSERLVELIDEYYEEAVRLRTKYADQIKLLIGFETDWIRPGSTQLVNDLLKKHAFDLFVGSVHHVETIPIDYSHELYRDARNFCGGTDEKLFERYFDQQYDMLRAWNPPVVGHFDLIRLKSDDPERSFQQWPEVWRRILRNLDYISEYGGLVELNSAAIRKGMSEPYPNVEICKEHLKRNGRFCLSDDSHGANQVGLNYIKVLDAIKNAGISKLHFLSAGSSTFDARFNNTILSEVSISDVSGWSFWSQHS